MDWKQILGPWFSVPRTFRVSSYHVFMFDKNNLGSMKVKEHSTFTEWKDVCLLKRGVTVEAVREGLNSVLRSSDFRLEKKDISAFPSQQEKNRKAYLVKNVLERYYRRETALNSKYFSNGADWSVAGSSQ